MKSTVTPSRIVALLGTLLAVLCTPPLAGALFCLDHPRPSDALPGWLFSGALLALSWLVVDRHGDRRRWLPPLFLALLTLVGTELATRIVLIHFTVWPRQKMVQIGRWAYPELAAYRAHPFLQFTGRPRAALAGNEALGGLPPFNERGFLGPDLPVAKPPGTIRIVCLGASTTQSGYPPILADLLRDDRPGTAFETVDLAHGYYTTNHAVVNFALNGLDYHPDYVVVHHGWNEVRMKANADAFRGDYSHVLEPFELRASPDALLVRASTIYRFIKHRLSGDPDAAHLDAAIFRRADPALGYRDAPVAATFERNIRTIVDLALARGITPVLVTQPHSQDPSVPFASDAEHIARYAALLRATAARWPRRVVLVDLDAEMTGHEELFKDVGHMTKAGVRQKARRIADAILDHLRR